MSRTCPFCTVPELPDVDCEECSGTGFLAKDDTSCYCMARCSCECMCGAWDDVECGCWDYLDNEEE